MQFLYIHEVLRLLLNQNNNTPESFISIFNKSNSLIGFNYSCKRNKFTHVSDSFESMFGYKRHNMLDKDTFISKMIHPHDKVFFVDFLFGDNGINENFDAEAPLKVNELKCRVKHIKGYWKYLIVFLINYFERENGEANKIGLIVDQYFNPNYQAITNNIYQVNWEDITSGKSAFMYNSSEIQISHRESEILELLGDGKIAKEIASKLNISPNTVITHRKNLISKFRVKNTAQLIKMASQLMLI